MQLIQCPWCGPREEAEFCYGGQAHIRYPQNPAALSDEEWGVRRARIPVWREMILNHVAEHSLRLPRSY